MIGRLRHKIIIIRPSYRSDGSGGQIADGETRRPGWAYIMKAAGNETLNNGAVTNAKTENILIRRTDVQTSDHIIMDGAAWKISDISAYKDRAAYLILSIRRDQVTGA